MSENKRNTRKSFEGVVVSDKMNKTRVVALNWTKPHPQYGKIMHLTTKVHAHDEKNESKTGDRVRVTSTRKLSKTKNWRVSSILAKH